MHVFRRPIGAEVGSCILSSFSHHNTVSTPIQSRNRIILMGVGRATFRLRRMRASHIVGGLTLVSCPSNWQTCMSCQLLSCWPTYELPTPVLLAHIFSFCWTGGPVNLLFMGSQCIDSCSPSLPHLFTSRTDTMVQFLWRDDMLSVARFMADCFDHFQSGGDPS